MTPLRFCGTIPGMKLAVLAAVFSMSIPLAAEQAGGSRQPAGAPTSPDKIAEAYNQFLLGHRLEEKDDESGAIAAFKRAMELDPNAAEIPAELASVYLRQNKVQEAMSAAEQALKVAPANRAANRRRRAHAPGARRLLRARAALERRGGRLRADPAAHPAQHRREDALRVGADERRRQGQRGEGARRAGRDRRGARHRSASAVSALAGTAPARRLRRRRSVGAQARRAEPAKPVGLLRARRSPRGAARLPGSGRRAGADRRRVPRQDGRHLVRRRHPAAASRLRLSGARTERENDFDLRRSAQADARRSRRRELPVRGEHRGEEA